MNAKQILLIVLCAVIVAVSVVLILRFLGVKSPVPIAGGVAGGMVGAVAGSRLGRKSS